MSSSAENLQFTRLIHALLLRIKELEERNKILEESERRSILHLTVQDVLYGSSINFAAFSKNHPECYEEVALLIHEDIEVLTPKMYEYLMDYFGGALDFALNEEAYAERREAWLRKVPKL